MYGLRPPKTLLMPSRPAKLVYLDLNHWIALAKVVAGNPRGVDHRDIYDACLRAKEDKTAAFPISDAIYMEVSKIGQYRRVPPSRRRKCGCDWRDPRRSYSRSRSQPTRLSSCEFKRAATGRGISEPKARLLLSLFLRALCAEESRLRLLNSVSGNQVPPGRDDTHWPAAGRCG